MIPMKTSADDLRLVARHRVQHYLSNFTALEEQFPALYPRMITHAEGAFLYDDSGRKLLDAGVHMGACQIGHCRKEVAMRISEQAERLDFFGLGEGLSHPAGALLAEALAPIVPAEDPTFYYMTSGSEAVEAAIKLSRAYHCLRNEPQRFKILSREGSYHGATYGATSAAGLVRYRKDFGPLLAGFFQVGQPSPSRCRYCEGTCDLSCVEAIEHRIETEGAETVAAVLAEPISNIQAVKVPHDQYWKRLREICDRTGVLLIADEVVTGFGRTGKWFGLDHWQVKADFVTMAKGLTSGYVPMGALAVGRPVASLLLQHTLGHLNTFGGHPVSCVAALANIDILARERLVERAALLEVTVRERLTDIAAQCQRISETAVKGLLASIEIDVSDCPADQVERMVRQLRHNAFESGVLPRFGNYGDRIGIMFFPPLVVSENDLNEGLHRLGQVINALD